AGAILAAAAARGLRLTEARRDLMWVRKVNGRVEVAGLSARWRTFFGARTHCMFTMPLFIKLYRAPATQPDVPKDERSLVFTLAAMLVEWVTGRYPFRCDYGYLMGDESLTAGVLPDIVIPEAFAALARR